MKYKGRSPQCNSAINFSAWFFLFHLLSDNYHHSHESDFLFFGSNCCPQLLVGAWPTRLCANMQHGVVDEWR